LESLEQLFKQARAPLISYANSLVMNEEDAKDVVQEVFTECFTEGMMVNRAYLFRSVRNRSFNRMRGRARLHNFLGRLKVLLPLIQPFERDESPHLRVDEAMQRLPQKQREVLTLRIKNELSINEIALVLDIPEGTVKSRINAAVGQLRESLRSME
jgi:RNA polymerase sigma-70 factor (ECF subfamily)